MYAILAKPDRSHSSQQQINQQPQLPASKKAKPHLSYSSSGGSVTPWLPAGSTGVKTTAGKHRGSVVQPLVQSQIAPCKPIHILSAAIRVSSASASSTISCLIAGRQVFWRLKFSKTGWRTPTSLNPLLATDQP